MREDIVGMLKNAIDHGGNPVRVAQSLINSGYPMKEVREAYEYIRSLNLQSSKTLQPSQSQIQTTQQQTAQQSVKTQAAQNTPQGSQSVIKMPSPPSYPSTYKKPLATTPQLQPLKPLPSQRTNPSGTGKIVILAIILILLVISLVSVIIFKDNIMDLFRL